MINITMEKKYGCKIGNNINTYIISKFLGSGRQSSVWETTNNVAIKVFRNDGDVEEYNAELETLRSFSGSVGLIKLLDNFTIITKLGQQNCLVLEHGGISLSDHMRNYYKTNDEALTTKFVQCVTRQILSGLCWLHSKNMMHLDIKPGNILVKNISADYADTVIADFGYCKTGYDCQYVGTQNYMAPEVILERLYNYMADIWSTFAMCFYLMTNFHIFDVYGDENIIYGDDVDTALEKIANDEFASDDDNIADNNMSSDSSDNLSDNSSDNSLCSKDSSSEDDDQNLLRHILLMVKVLGKPPPEFIIGAEKYFESDGSPKTCPNITPININDLIAANNTMDEKDRNNLSDFMTYGLVYLPQRRITAEKALQLPWLSY